MARHLLLTLVFVMAVVALHAQTSLKGQVTDADNGQPIIYGTVALYKNGVLVTGAETDFDGYYSITELDPGTYDVEFSYTGYQTQRVEGVAILEGKSNILNVQLQPGITIETVVVTWKKPLIEKDNTTQGQILTSEEIQKIPTRSVNALASLAAGVSSSDEGGALTIRGSRSNATNYYIDGVRVARAAIPKSEIEQLQVITGGVEARYGDVTGGIVSITTKGPSDRFGGGVELETSEFLDAFGHNLLTANVSGPIWKRNGETLLGFRISGQYQSNEDDDPPAIPVYRVKDEVLAELEANPIRLIGGTPFPAAEWVDNSGVNALDANPFERSSTLDIVGKLDAAVSKNVDLTFSGSYFNSRNRFTPGGWQVFNSHNNPTTKSDGYRLNFRLRHRLGTSTITGQEGEQRKGSLIQNAAYILQFGYERSFNSTADRRHGDRLFDYGYIGNYDLTWEPSINTILNLITEDTLLIYPGHVDYTRTFNGFTPGTANPVLTRYIHNADDADDYNDFLVRNGFIPSDLSSVWGLHTNVGVVYNSFSKGVGERLTFNANTSFELVPGGSGGARHNIQMGFTYEERISRSYSVAPIGLWTVARLHANEHIEGQGLDSTQVLYTIDGKLVKINLFTEYTDTIDIQVPIFAPKIVPTSNDNLFFKKVREKFGIPLNQYINVDGMNPADLSLDLFSARELNDLGLVSYVGYDYLGNQIDGITFDDFFRSVDENGIRNFPVAAFRPNYQSAYIQDKFTFRDIIFRLGLRVDRYDANTKVLRDPYSLYDIMTAKDFSQRFGVQLPGNIGDDFKVYVTSEGGETIQAFRDGDTWYFPNGNPANDGSEIFGGGIVFPRYSEDDETKRDITSPNFQTDISFKDYEPQINWMPRLAFSFPISEDANFFAHYDILVQRPPSNTFVSPLTYFYWETSGSGLRNNAALKPERTVDYEVGFQQKLSQSSALKLSAYYKELRDMIQSRFIQFVPAPVNIYETYDNLDFATVKGFSIGYDLRRTGNVSLNLNYTLQFADGTGSDANSSRGLGSRSIQRVLFPLSYDERHIITGIFDFRYGSGKRYNGPRIAGVDIFANAGLNITGRAVSGRPYTKAVEPAVLGAQGIAATINSSRLPWTFLVNVQVDKDFNLAGPEAPRPLFMNVYLRISNVLDRRNIINVYRFTGSPTDDGFLSSARGQAFLESGINPGQSLEAYLASYQWRLLNPDNFSLPRRIFLGASINF